MRRDEARQLLEDGHPLARRRDLGSASGRGEHRRHRPALGPSHATSSRFLFRVAQLEHRLRLVENPARAA
jgi:hypothetical protein